MIKKWLTELEILPITNPSWTKFDICIYPKEISNENEYKEVKKTIRENVPKGTSGVYLINKAEKVLYIGESKNYIHSRIRRHIDKIYIRNDSRSEFFKLTEHQGNLSIYYLELPIELISKRKVIESLLTIALKPEYQNWELKKKMKEIKTIIDDINKLKLSQEEGLEDGDFYDEFDKDDMLDRLGQHTPRSRQYWEKYVELKINYGADGILTINLGAEDPIDLESNTALEFATRIANKKGFSTFHSIEDEIRLYGQNCLTERMYYFRK